MRNCQKVGISLLVITQYLVNFHENIVTLSKKIITYLVFSESLVMVGERLIGPFNIADVVEPIDIKISDAIMAFQESGYEVTQKVC